MKNPQSRNQSPFAEVGSTEDTIDNFLRHTITTIRSADSLVVHFICNTGGHWVTVSLIKQAGHVPQIIYMDSLNTQLINISRATHFIQFIYADCLA